jgi:hypothetical protein
LAGLPEGDHAFQAAEDADEECHEEGVNGRGYPALRLGRLGGEAQAGEVGGQGAGLMCHEGSIPGWHPGAKDFFLRT